MLKKVLFIFLLTFILPSYAFEDCIIFFDSKLANIKVKEPAIVEISPLITIMNEKNILLIHPLKPGNTSFGVTRQGGETLDYKLEISENKTVVYPVEGCEIFSLDLFSPEFDLDLPPLGVSNNG